MLSNLSKLLKDYFSNSAVLLKLFKELLLISKSSEFIITHLSINYLYYENYLYVESLFYNSISTSFFYYSICYFYYSLFYFSSYYLILSN